MPAIETVGGEATIGAGPVFTAVTPYTGQSLTVRNCDLASRVSLDAVWGQFTTAGQIRIRSPRLHDFVNGIRFRVNAVNQPTDLIGVGLNDTLIPQDTLTVELNGTAAEHDQFGMNVYYDNLPGIDARLATWDQIRPRIVHLTSNDITTTGPAADNWSAGTAFSAGSWAPDPNTDYAILGYECATLEASVAFQGTDTGNLKVGGPGATDPEFTRDFFVRQSLELGKPYIPIINSANNATLQVFSANIAGTATAMTVLLAQLQ